MKLQYLRAFIVLLAALITLIINMKMGRMVVHSLLIELIVILIFYVIGTLVVEIIQKELAEADDETSASEEEINDEVSAEENSEQKESVAFSFEDDME